MKRTVSIAILAMFVVVFCGIASAGQKAEDKKSKAVQKLEERIEKLSVEPEGETEKETTVREKAIELLKKELDKQIELEKRRGEDPTVRKSREAFEKAEKSSKRMDDKMRKARNSISLTGCPLDDTIKVNPSLGTDWGWRRTSSNSSIELTIVNPLEKGLTVRLKGAGLNNYIIDGLCPGGEAQIVIASRSLGPQSMDVVITATATDGDFTYTDEYKNSITRVDRAEYRTEKVETWILRLR